MWKNIIYRKNNNLPNLIKQQMQYRNYMCWIHGMKLIDFVFYFFDKNNLFFRIPYADELFHYHIETQLLVFCAIVIKSVHAKAQAYFLQFAVVNSVKTTIRSYCNFTKEEDWSVRIHLMSIPTKEISVLFWPLADSIESQTFDKMRNEWICLDHYYAASRSLWSTLIWIQPCFE